MEDKDLFILHDQCYGCWWPGDARSQGISSHGIDLLLPECPSFSTRRVNTLRPRQNGRHFADEIFKCILLNENVWITIKNSLKFVPKGPINNIPALVQIMAWRRPGDKPLFEPMLVSLPTHICVTRPQWVNILKPEQNGLCFADNIFKCIFMAKKLCILIQISMEFISMGLIHTKSALVHQMDWHQTGNKPLLKPKLIKIFYAIWYCVTRPQWVNS